ncbi:hypothetical protein F2P81_019637 [Scophthalmus maximus]|uniref:Chemokine interleukin-8-like domain-containing protein n=1 Tax=Scophthalmus maximus TaxID=52904 RepID=A0A6A4SA69_SCOMX|nr:hypothetical protein F2P81_019637 [Scophthalmus maximus]
MVSGGVLMKCALVAVVLVAVVESGPTAQKLASCCTEVNKLEITEPILDYMIQKSNPPCVKAVIFQTESGLYCSYHRALWVGRKIKELSFRTDKGNICVDPKAEWALKCISLAFLTFASSSQNKTLETPRSAELLQQSKTNKGRHSRPPENWFHPRVGFLLFTSGTTCSLPH